MINILLAEDDPNLGMVVKEYLEMKGYQVNHYPDGAKAKEALEQNNSFDLLILDVMMPRLDGFNLVKQIRKTGNTAPVIFTTAKNKLSDKAEGFKLGADDYLTKPFSIEELVMRIEAVWNRAKENQNEIDQDRTEFKIGQFMFEYNKRLLYQEEGELKKLSSRENELLKMLCLHEGKLLERSEALSKIWGAHNYYTSRSMDVYITKLRKYLRPDENVEIINVHGEGFKLLVHAS